MFFGLFGKNINKGLLEFSETPGSVLLDVRTPEEYHSGHIKGSVNIPLDEISSANSKIPDKDTPVFVYCASGSRSAAAVNMLRHYGFIHTVDIGGIYAYKGDLV
ncbi:MAG: rhodanese-like domain-containing protein [Candidatus Fimenecus sp.]